MYRKITTEKLPRVALDKRNQLLSMCVHSAHCAEVGGTAHDHPSVEGEMGATAGEVDPTPRRGYLNKLVEATALDTENQVRTRYRIGKQAEDG